MLDFGFYNMDCMEGIKEFPDKYFDLAIVDPPYGINVTKQGMGAGGGSHLTQTVHADEHRRRKTFWLRGAKQELGGGGGFCVPPKIYHSFDDEKIPDAEYFKELERVSKNRIIWGGAIISLSTCLQPLA